MVEAPVKLHACGKYLYFYTYLFYTYLSLPVLTDLFVFFSYHSFIIDYVVYSYSFIVTDIVVFFSQFAFIVSYAGIRYLYMYLFIYTCRVLRCKSEYEVDLRGR